MKARRKGTNDEFKAIERVVIDRAVIPVSELEFEGVESHATSKADERRERIAIAALQGLAANEGCNDPDNSDSLAELAVEYAEALIVALDKN